MSLLSGLLEHTESMRRPAPQPATAFDLPPLILTERGARTSLPTSAATASPEWLQVRDRYVSHIMGCRACYAPRGRYCQTGADLRQRYDSTPLVCRAESEHKRTNWIGIEADYRAGVLPLRFLTTKYGRPLSEIALRAKRDGWRRSPHHQETPP